MSASTYSLTIAKIKRVLLRSSGVDGIRALSRTLNVKDDCSGAKIPKANLIKALNDHGVTLTEKEAAALWTVFDRQGDGFVVPTEFLTALRQGLSPERRALIQRAWSVFEKDTQGHVSLQQLVNRFDATRHPSTIRGEVDARAIAAQFKSSFDVGTNPDGTVSKQEFEQYYAGVSGSIDSDSTFAALLRGCWHLPGTSDEETAALVMADDNKKFEVKQRLQEKESNLSQLKLRDIFQDTIQKHQTSLRSQRVGYRNLGRRLREADKDGSGYVAQSDFVDILWKGRLYFDEPAAMQLLDSNSNGTVDYVLYMAHVKGELSPCRQLMMERRWQMFPRDRTDSTTLSAIHKAYHASNGESLSQFLDAWDKSGAKSQVVSYAEFEEWLIPASLEIPLDNGFEEMLKTQWT
jgi:Ca2+-binding EF-hand superfamily protein